MPDSQTLIVFCTCPDVAAAERLADLAVDQGAAACVNVLPGIMSVYRWQGRIAHDAEVLLLAKTSVRGYPRLEALWREAHPYELPEVVAVPVTKGSDAYLAWVNDNVSE